MKNIISILIKDQFGALSRIIELFSSRGYNLNSICSGVCEIQHAQRLTLVVNEDEKNIQKIVKMLNGFIDVIDANIVNPETSYSSELMLIKLRCPSPPDSKLENLINAKNGEIIAQTKDRISFEISGSASYLDAIIEEFKPYDIVELARTGEAAIHR